MENKIRYYREKIGMTQEELAQKAGVSRVTISYLETGKQPVITSETMLKIAEALGKSVKTIFF